MTNTSNELIKAATGQGLIGLALNWVIAQAQQNGESIIAAIFSMHNPIYGMFGIIGVILTQAILILGNNGKIPQKPVIYYIALGFIGFVGSWILTGFIAGQDRYMIPVAILIGLLTPKAPDLLRILQNWAVNSAKNIAEKNEKGRSE